MLIPETCIGIAVWNTKSNTIVPYIQSTIRTTTLPTIANNLKKVLGSHLINRYVLLSNSVNSKGHSDGYTWTKSYCTLPSVGQITGNFASHNNKYDDGEANYKLPLFNFMEEYKAGYTFWLRGIYIGNLVYCINNKDIRNNYIDCMFGICPLIYIG